MSECTHDDLINTIVGLRMVGIRTEGVSGGICPVCGEEVALTEKMREGLEGRVIERRRKMIGAGFSAMLGAMFPAIYVQRKEEGHMARSIKARMTLEPKEYAGVDWIIVAINDFAPERKAAAEVWCDLNPWSKQEGNGPQVMIKRPHLAYEDAYKAERAHKVVKVIRLTEADIVELNRWDAKYGSGKEGR